MTEGYYYWQKFWLVSYAVALTLIPPLAFHGKNLFASELLLIPALLALPWMWEQRKKNISLGPLHCIFAALTVALIAGVFRGSLGTQISLYPMTKPDHFTLSGDLPPYFRWALIFSTPWLIAVVFANKHLTADWFLNVLKYCVLVSALMAMADHFGWIDLMAWNYHVAKDEWIGRSYGTFVSPLEASLVYGAMAAYLLTNLRKVKGTALAVNGVIIFACVGTLLMTRGGTAMVCLLLTIFVYIARAFLTGSQMRRRKLLGYFFIASLVTATAAALSLVPRPVLVVKWNDFSVRFVTWFRWLSILPQKPWILLTGIGFSGLIVDNSIILLFIKGGLFLLISVGWWLKKLYRFVPENLSYVFLFWVLTWLTLDSMGYWGLGRLSWLLLGLCSSNLVTDSAE